MAPYEYTSVTVLYELSLNYVLEFLKNKKNNTIFELNLETLKKRIKTIVSKRGNKRYYFQVKKNRFYCFD